MERPPSRSRAAGAPLSLEASLDEENREVLAALDRKRPRSPMVRGNRNAVSPAPVRSMLDINSPTPRHGSIAGIGVGITSIRKNSVGALDPADPSTWTSPHASKPNSPTLTRASLDTRSRSDPDTDSKGYVGLPRVKPGADRDFEQNYNFDMSSIPSSAGGAIKPPSDSKRPREGSGGAMAAALTGDFSSLQVGKSVGASGRHNSTGGGTQSRSPSSRIRSPTVESGGLLTPTSPPKRYMTGEGTVVDDKAHRRLSNKSSSFSTITTDEEGGGRVHKDALGEEDVLAESSDEDHHSTDSEDESRGRSTGRDKSVASTLAVSETDKAGGAKVAKGQSGPVEGETKRASHSQLIKSMLEPSISITSPTGEKMSQKSTGVHPSSNFGRGPPSSAGSNEDDEDGAIAKAKTLGLHISPLDTKVADRHVQMILRGNWAQINQDAVAGNRTTRTYLTCTDLSLEATYALEWTVGTIMRDGDTLLAIYAIEDETAGSGNKVTEAEKEVLHAEGAKAGKEAGDVMESLTKQTTRTGDTTQDKYIPATDLKSLTGSVDARKVTKKEMERLKAIEEITQTFLKLVRKTPLQVRCMVEVIHCKSPKHLILGAIDELEPTLTIVGTRGRSSLKGVLLGSFSNYLVTKSSAPVMVARKKLKKPKSHVRVSSNKIRLSNNLMASAIPSKRRSLTQARID